MNEYAQEEQRGIWVLRLKQLNSILLHMGQIASFQKMLYFSLIKKQSGKKKRSSLYDKILRYIQILKM